MRLVYLDEAGISSLAHEPYLVVAGVIVDGDRQWKPLVKHLEALSYKHISDDVAEHFSFHAKDIFHGSGYLDRTTWSRERRWALLTDLASIPAKFDLPIVAAFMHRPSGLTHASKQYPLMKHASILTIMHPFVFTNAIRRVEAWMTRYAPNEVAMLVAEESGRTQEMIKDFHSGYRRDELNESDLENPNVFHSLRIVDTVHFADRRRSALLQIADVCAFIIKRRLMRKSDCNAFYKLLEPQLVMSLKSGALSSQLSKRPVFGKRRPR